MKILWQVHYRIEDGHRDITRRRWKLAYRVMRITHPNDSDAWDVLQKYRQSYARPARRFLPGDFDDDLPF